ncbi:hypothetical protein CRM93_12775 [Acetobacter fabarum]|uniref:Uncharacterized protein n=2 Tax=Acetobacter fabarum TaxID=483199 RepID=A0A269XV66_9PROT|nr:hypothetical protein B8X00_11445 [Acetobacter fabarum]PEN22952.1 hypothetical protein CRM93_12775 [Acetobacter fabarum]
MTVEELTADLVKEHEEWLSHKPQTVYDLVKQIYEPLLKMKQDGRTDSEICDMLTKRHVDISAGTFATYMKRIAKELRGGTRPRTARKQKPDSEALRATPDSRVNTSVSDSKEDSSAQMASRPKPDSAPAPSASPSMAGFTSRKPPALDA